jgi:hypothetical protein
MEFPFLSFVTVEPPRLSWPILGRPRLGRMVRLLAAGVILLSTVGAAAAAVGLDSVRIYPAAGAEPVSAQFKVSIGDQNVPVYLAQVLGMDPEKRVHSDIQHFAPGDVIETSFASFDLRDAAAATVTVTCPDAVTAAKVMPNIRGIAAQVSGNQVTFKVDKPGPLVVEVNGDWRKSLQLFVDPWDDAAPDPHDPKVIYFGPGIHKVPEIRAGSGQTVYLAGGAFVYCINKPPGFPKDPPVTGPDGIVEKGPGSPGSAAVILVGDNITLRGRGVIDCSLCTWHSRGAILATGKNIKIEGLVIRDPATNGVVPAGCDNLQVKNLKIFGYRGNSDGCDLMGVRDSTVDGCYIRTADDLVSIGAKHYTGETHNLKITNCVLWNELAHALFMGSAIQELCENVTFSDCDVIRDKGRGQVLGLINAESGTARNTVFENIRVEECQWLIKVGIAGGVFSHDLQKGHVEGVTFRNIVSVAPERPTVPNHPNPFVDINGWDAAHVVNGVAIEHVMVDGHPLRADQVLRGKFVGPVTVTP